MCLRLCGVFPFHPNATNLCNESRFRDAVQAADSYLAEGTQRTGFRRIAVPTVQSPFALLKHLYTRSTEHLLFDISPDTTSAPTSTKHVASQHHSPSSQRARILRRKHTTLRHPEPHMG